MKILVIFCASLLLLCTRETIIPIYPIGDEDDLTGDLPGFEMKRSLDELFTKEIYDYYNDKIIPNEGDFDKVIYIDPDYYGGNSDGTIEKPYTSINTTPFSANTAYLIKRGTTHGVIGSYGHYSLPARTDNIMLGAYGDGERPVLTGHRIRFRGDNNTVRDLEGEFVWTHGDAPRNAILFNAKSRSTGSFGVGMKIIGSEISDCNQNGVFIQQWDLSEDQHVEIAYSHIHKVNQAWTPTTGQWQAYGDGIQISQFRGTYHIHNNIIDRSDTGNKFAIIVNAHTNDGNMVSGIVENNYLYGPMPVPDGGSVLYFGNVEPTPTEDAHHTIIVRNNYMQGSTYDGEKYTGAAIYSNSSKFEVFGNYVKACHEPVFRLGNQLFGKNKVFDNTVIPF